MLFLSFSSQERFAWRIAILLPIYKNCTSGHWKHGHKNPVIGDAFHYFMAAFGILFFLNQVIASDLIKFVQYLNGWEQIDAMAMMGLQRFKMLCYHRGLVVSWLAYGFILLGGFSHYCIFLRQRNVVSAKHCRTFYKAKVVLKGIFLSMVLAVAFLASTRRRSESVVNKYSKSVSISSTAPSAPSSAEGFESIPVSTARWDLDGLGLAPNRFKVPDATIAKAELLAFDFPLPSHRTIKEVVFTVDAFNREILAGVPVLFRVSTDSVLSLLQSCKLCVSHHSRVAFRAFTTARSVHIT